MRLLEKVFIPACAGRFAELLRHFATIIRRLAEPIHERWHVSFQTATHEQMLHLRTTTKPQYRTVGSCSAF